MIIFEPARHDLNREEYRVLAIELARKVVPGGAFLSSEVKHHCVSILIQEGRDLVSFGFYPGRMSAMDWKRMEETQGEGKTNRIYIVAQDFEEKIFTQVSEAHKRTSWFKWFLLQSNQETAVSFHPYRNYQEKFDPSTANKEYSDFAGQHSLYERLTTPEFVALSRLGMALRARRS